MSKFIKNITIELTFFIFRAIYEFMKVLDSNLYLQKVCRLNQTIEPDLNTKCDDERRGILFVSEVNAKYMFIAIFMHTLITIFATSWSDKAGRRRRPLIYIAILGQIFQTLSGCLNSYFWQWSPFANIIPWIILESVSGSIMLISYISYVYICDVSDAESRTMRIGFLGSLRLISLILGKGGSGYVLRKFGFYYSYLICFALSVSGLLLGIIFIKDTSVWVEKKISFFHIFKLKHMILDSFRVVFDKNLGRKRITVSMLLMVNVVGIFTYFGELSVIYQYLRYRFGMNEETFGYYMFFKLCVSALGILFCTSVLSKHFKIHDGILGILAAVFDTLAIIMLLFADQLWQIYLITLIDIFHGTALSVCLSFISKYYKPDEVGRLYAVNGVFSLLIPLSYPAYNTIYHNTLDSFPSAFCLLSVVLDIVIVLLYWSSFRCSKKYDKENKPPRITDVEEEACAMTAPS